MCVEAMDFSVKYWYRIADDKIWHRVYWYNHIGLCGKHCEYGGSYSNNLPALDEMCEQCTSEWVLDDLAGEVQ
jgi:hypothetical protein